MGIERTFAIIKFNAVKAGNVGRIISEIEGAGLVLRGMRLAHLTPEVCQEFYQEHVGKPFFEELVAFVTSGPTVQMVWQGKDAVAQVRKMNGATNCANADVGTIRGDFGLSQQKNLIHASDAPETAVREIALYFRPEELLDYTLPFEEWRR